MTTATRRLEFDAAHRVTRHGSKCANLHGHRYAVDVTIGAEQLDDAGFVLDYGIVKQVVGGWIDQALDHGTILCERDGKLIELCRVQGWKLFVLDDDREPTAEHLAALIANEGGKRLVQAASGVFITNVRVYETPNCWADFRPHRTITIRPDVVPGR